MQIGWQERGAGALSTEEGADPVNAERAPIRVGTAGWAIPGPQAAAFGPGPSHLARYATRFSAVEINTSFYRPHRPATYRRWAASVPPRFQFAVKVPRTISHERRLAESEPLLDLFLRECGALGPALGPLLLQLPPSLQFEEPRVARFLSALRARFDGAVVCEPRHPSWFLGEAEALLAAHRIAQVAADPAVVPRAAEPGGWEGLVYYRLHGAPRIYYSAYDAAALATLAAKLRAAARRGSAWCIFDNTAAGAATEDVRHLQERLGAV
jgi:uncharacterized protein YecE (DUF72 family)